MPPTRWIPLIKASLSKNSFASNISFTSAAIEPRRIAPLLRDPPTAGFLCSPTKFPSSISIKFSTTLPSDGLASAVSHTDARLS